MKRILTNPILVFFLLLVAGCSESTEFSAPSVPTSLAPVATRVSSLDLRYQITPLPLTAKSLTSVDLILNEQNASSCYGIPGKADIFPVLQLSNKSGDLWKATTSQYHEFLRQSDQDVGVQIVFTTENSSEPTIRTPRELSQGQLLLPAGHADLARAVEDAVRLSQQYGRPGVRPVILFFLNEKIPSSPDLADRMSRARELGFTIYAVTAPFTEDAVSQQPSLVDFEGLLGPEEFVVNPDATGLRKLLVQSTGGSTQLAAQNIETTVLWTPLDLFQPSLDSRQDLLAVNNHVLWKNSIVEADNSRQVTIQGQIDPNFTSKSAGFTATLSYTDCNGFQQLQTAHLELLAEPFSIVPTNLPLDDASAGTPDTGQPSLPDGQMNPSGVPEIGGLPSWLVELVPALPSILPALKWVLLAALLLAALYLMIKYMRNLFKKPTPPPPPPAPPHLPVKDTIPGWLKALRAEAVSSTSLPIGDGNELQETILIGLGPIGRDVLSNLSVLLNGRYGESWHAKVRLVYVDVAMSRNEHVTLPYGMDETQFLILHPDFEEVRKTLVTSAQEWTHWDWYDYYSTSPSRAHGRMALFYDLKDGIAQSRFFSIVEKASLSLSKPAVRIIGTTFDEVSSGMLVDVARLTQIILRRDLDVQLWLMSSLGRDWTDTNGRRLTANEQNTRTLATLRELERFERNAPNSYLYVSQDSVNDILRQSYDYAVVQTLFVFDPEFTASKREEIVDAMVDSLLATLSPSVNSALAKYLLDHRSRVSDVVQRQGKGVMCGIGTFSVKTANTLIEDAMAWRLVRDVLFGEEVGLYPVEHCDVNSGAYGAPISVQRASLDLGERDTIFGWFHSLNHHHEWDQFVSLITDRLNEILNGGNGERSIDLSRRRQSINLAAKWLRQLEEESKSFPHWDVAKQTEKLKKLLSSLNEWFQGELFELCRENFDESRRRLERLRSQKRRESNIPANLEWTEYKLYVRQMQSDSRSTGEDLLPKFGRRFGWRVRYDESGKQWVLDWLLPPRDFGWTLGLETNDFVLPYAADAVLAALYHMALTYARTGSAISATELAKSHASATWIENAQPILNFNATEASRIAGGLTTLNVLAAPRLSDPIATDELYQRLTAVSNQKIELCETGDSSTLTIMRVVGWIPFESARIYETELWQRKAPTPSHYVWKAEQLASNIEDDQHLTAPFVSWIGQDEDVLRAISLCLLYKLIVIEEDGWLLPGWNEPIKGASWSDMVTNFFARDVRSNTFRLQRALLLTTWNDQINQQRKRRSEQIHTYFKIFSQEYLEADLQSDNSSTRDLATYLQALIKQEKTSRSMRNDR